MSDQTAVTPEDENLVVEAAPVAFSTPVSLADQIFATDDIDTEDVTVPEWGVTIQVRSLTARDRTRILQQSTNPDGTTDFGRSLVDLVIACSYNPATGNKVFTQDQRERLLSKSTSAIEQIARVASRISKLEVESAKKDSSSTTSDTSASN